MRPDEGGRIRTPPDRTFEFKSAVVFLLRSPCRRLVRSGKEWEYRKRERYHVHDFVLHAPLLDVSHAVWLWMRGVSHSGDVPFKEPLYRLASFLNKKNLIRVPDFMFAGQ